MRQRLRDHPVLRPLVPVLRPAARAGRGLRRRLRPFLPHWVWRLTPAAAARTARWVAGVARRIRRRRRETRLTVAVDVLALWEPLTGVGWYLYRLLEHLADRDDLALRLYGLALVRAPGIPESPVPLPAGPAIEHVCYEVPDDLVLGQRWLVPLLRKLEPLLVAADRNRVVWAPNYILPPPFRGSTAPLVATVHDLGVHAVPWAVRPDTLAAMRQILDRTLYEATLLVTPSAAVRDDLVAAGVRDAARIRPIHHGLGQASAQTPDGESPRPPRGTPARYVLHVGTLEPRKNLLTLIAAAAALPRPDPAAPDLVLAGGFGWRSEEIRRAVAAGAAAGWLHHPGYVADDQLAALYRGALLIALPSWYEGFGLPAVEAMAAGVPLLLSDIPVFREVAGDAALYVPPGDTAGWTAALARLAGDPELRTGLARRGRERAGRFRWTRSAEQHAAVLREAAGIG